MTEDNWDDFPQYKAANVVWKRKLLGAGYKASINGQAWEIRLNDFPSEPAYTLIVERQEILHFNDWPECWIKPR